MERSSRGHYGQTPVGRTEQRQSPGCGAQGVNVAVESQAPSPVLFLAGADKRGALSVTAVTAHRQPQSQARRTVQPRCTKEYERSVRVLGASDSIARSSATHQQGTVPSGLSRTPEQHTPREASKTGSKDAGHVARSTGTIGHESRSSHRPANLRLVGPPSELGKVAVLGPSRSQPIRHLSRWEEEFSGKQTRPKTTGADKSIQSRPVVVSSCCNLREPRFGACKQVGGSVWRTIRGITCSSHQQRVCESYVQNCATTLDLRSSTGPCRQLVCRRPHQLCLTQGGLSRPARARH